MERVDGFFFMWAFYTSGLSSFHFYFLWAGIKSNNQ